MKAISVVSAVRSAEAAQFDGSLEHAQQLEQWANGYASVVTQDAPTYWLQVATTKGVIDLRQGDWLIATGTGFEVLDPLEFGTRWVPAPPTWIDPPEDAPGHTDLMVPPETIDEALKQTDIEDFITPKVTSPVPTKRGKK